MLGFLESLERCAPEAILAAVSTLPIIVCNPRIDISLELLKRVVDSLAKRDAVELRMVRWKRSQMPLVCGERALVLV
jgi:hypothetical protein